MELHVLQCPIRLLDVQIEKFTVWMLANTILDLQHSFLLVILCVYMNQQSYFEFQHKQHILLYFNTSRQTVGPTETPPTELIWK